MGRNSLRNEPSKFLISDVASATLQQASWLTYVHQLQGFDTEVEIEFLQNLQEGHTMLKGRIRPVT